MMLDGLPVGGGALATRRMADRASSELQHAVVAEIVQQLVHLAAWMRRKPPALLQAWTPVLLEIQTEAGVYRDLISRSVS